jgi:hypothetical protein
MAPLYDAWREVFGAQAISNNIGRSAELPQPSIHA